MSEDNTSHLLLDELPDLVIQMRRDGRILAYAGGRGVPGLVPIENAIGQTAESIWSPALAALLKKLIRRVIAARGSLEASFSEEGRSYALRVQAQSPTRALCLIRAETSGLQAGEAAMLQPLGLNRRGFLRNFQAILSKCAIAEKSAAVVVIYLDGLNDVARLFDTSLSDEIVAAAIRHAAAPRDGLGELDDGMLGIVLETADRCAIEAFVDATCKSLSHPVRVGNGVFHLTPYAGVAILGQDADAAQSLMDHARAAATEARRTGSSGAHFFSDTLKLKSLARLDTTRELREAISGGDIGMRYVGRYDLSTGQLVTLVSYVQWRHPLRGEIPPREFLTIAEASGNAVLLSRAMLHSLQKGLGHVIEGIDAAVKISYGPLRHHLLHDSFVEDIERFLSSTALHTGRLEVRIPEKTFVILRPSISERLHRLGVQLVVDEVGRGMASFDRLAQAPLWGLQLDRVWVEALRNDAVALKVCRVGITAATALGLHPIATGVDDPEQRLALLALGCTYGTGDLYAATLHDSKAKRAHGAG